MNCYIYNNTGSEQYMISLAELWYQDAREKVRQLAQVFFFISFTILTPSDESLV